MSEKMSQKNPVQNVNQNGNPYHRGSIILPESTTVPAGCLEKMLCAQNFSSSYKPFWFRAMFAEILAGSQIITYRRLVARMIASAWYPVVYFNLNLGHNDKLADAVGDVQKILHIRKEEKEKNIIKLIIESKEPGIEKHIRHFTNLVPFRLIHPFYQKELEEERRINGILKDSKINTLIEFYNRAAIPDRRQPGI